MSRALQLKFTEKIIAITVNRFRIFDYNRSRIIVKPRPKAACGN